MQDVENLLESYFMMADNTYQGLISIGEGAVKIFFVKFWGSRYRLAWFQLEASTCP